ncbi:unnamed protein product [Blumeria hordei]|uniref:Uncharacterized protein n=1 Tax=Blumeria hordei TaxID=2867405 RepID=A0A383USL5_BLUHO|nr:unnamed protein product [Blumeria hordei]
MAPVEPVIPKFLVSGTKLHFGHGKGSQAMVHSVTRSEVVARDMSKAFLVAICFLIGMLVAGIFIAGIAMCRRYVKKCRMQREANLQRERDALSEFEKFEEDSQASHWDTYVIPESHNDQEW